MHAPISDSRQCEEMSLDRDGLPHFWAVHPPYRLMAIKCGLANAHSKAIAMMGTVRLLRACLVALALLAASTSARPALAQANFDRPGGDYLSSPVPSGDPADCALVCERDRRCRAWSFNYPTDVASSAVCWLKNNVPARVQDNCCVSGVRGAGVVEPRNDAIETSIDRFGGDYQQFRTQEQRRRRRLQGRLRRRQQMPGLDLCAAGLCRQGRALLSEKGNQAAAAQGRVYFGRGAVASTSRQRSAMTAQATDAFTLFVRLHAPSSTPACASAGAAAARRWRAWPSTGGSAPSDNRGSDR